MGTGRLFYDDEHDALAQMIANGPYQLKEVAAHLWPGMKPDSAYAKMKACLNPQGDQQFKFHEIIAAMKFCGQFDPLYHLCDETLHARPPRIAPADEEVKLVECINSATSVLQKALLQLERLRTPTLKRVA